MGVEIIVNLTRSSDGRLTGTVRPAGSLERRDFQGVMDLMAQLERIIDLGAVPASDN
jgi:hypothetical protein